MCFKKIIKVQNPIVTIPQFPTWVIDRYYFVRECKKQGLEPASLLPNSILYGKIRYTDLKHTDLLIQDLMPHLPRSSTDWSQYCWWQAVTAFSRCIERYKINAMAVVLDLRSELENPNAHAYNVIAYGNKTGLQGLLLFEPNEDWEWSGIVPWGEHNYKPEIVLI
uniref:Agglutinin C-terminal domain-containing protein n=1 Tax=viral metagenome TaxID=1070528 RepID=A0A6M3IQJ5_9ZZZZ